MLNSLWGKYAMQTNKTIIAVIKTRKDLLSYLHNELIEVKDINIYQSVAHVFYVDKPFAHMGSLDSNIVIGCFVTCYGRLKLYEE